MFPFVAALTQEGGIIIDKITLTRERMETRVFIPITFIILFILAALFSPWLGWITPELFTLKYQILFWLMIVVAIVWNIFYYKGAQAEKVHDFELIIMAQPLFTILLASIFLQNEQNWLVVLAAIVAAVTLILSRIQKEHVAMTPALWGLVVVVVLMSVELIITDYLLKVFSPVALYSIRCGFIALFFFVFYRPHFRLVSLHHYGLISMSAALGVAQMVTKFYGFEKFGVIYTSLVLMLSPVIVYIISSIYLHEKVKVRQIISGLIILTCIAFATIAGK